MPADARQRAKKRLEARRSFKQTAFVFGVAWNVYGQKPITDSELEAEMQKDPD